MKHVFAIIKPVRLEPVREALEKVGVTGMTVSDVRGFGSQGGIVDTYRGVEYRVDWVQKIRLDIVVSDPFLEPTITAIMESAHTGEVGDGKIFVSDIEAAYRVRTSEKDEAAITPAVGTF